LHSKTVSMVVRKPGGFFFNASYNAASPSITATENLTLPFIWIVHNSSPGRMASDQSVTMDTAEKKKLTLLFKFGLQVPPADSSHSVVIGWHKLAMAMMKMMAAMTVTAIMAYSAQTKRRRASAIRSRHMQMLHLIGMVQDT
jgi:hypothetical protein